MKQILCLDFQDDCIECQIYHRDGTLVEVKNFKIGEYLGDYLKNTFLNYEIIEIGVYGNYDDKIIEELENYYNINVSRTLIKVLKELADGILSDVDNALYIDVRKHIKAKVVINHSIYRGYNNMAGSFEKMISKDKKGHIRTFDELASISMMENKMNIIDEGDWDINRILEEANNKNEKCLSVVDEFFSELTIGLYNMIQCFDPEVIIIDGDFTNNDFFIKKLKKNLDKIYQIENISTKMPKIELL